MYGPIEKKRKNTIIIKKQRRGERKKTNKRTRYITEDIYINMFFFNCWCRLTLKNTNQQEEKKTVHKQKKKIYVFSFM
jgi:hypothetical protein